MLPWLLCGILFAVILFLILKIRAMQKSMDEICDSVMTHLSGDTNRLVTVSSGDRYVRRLAEQISVQLELLRKQRRQYLNGDRELKETVTSISHDLRTPLTAICGYLDLLEKQENSEAVCRYLSCIENRVEALKSLTEELFRYSVILSTDQELSLEPLSLRAAIEESLAAFYGAFCERGIKPQISLPDAPVMRDLNRAAIARVFGNILGNALKYSDGDLSVTLTENGEVLFSNTASALDNVSVGRLFDRFFSVEAARYSTGLGLSIAKTLTEQMGGTITAEYEDAVLTIRIQF